MKPLPRHGSTYRITSLHSPIMTIDVCYATPQAHRIVNVALHQEYSTAIVFIFSHERKDLYHV
jgi:predicted nicotinamide N-methyase